MSFGSFGSSGVGELRGIALPAGGVRDLGCWCKFKVVGVGVQASQEPHFACFKAQFEQVDPKQVQQRLFGNKKASLSAQSQITLLSFEEWSSLFVRHLKKSRFVQLTMETHLGAGWWHDPGPRNVDNVSPPASPTSLSQAADGYISLEHQRPELRRVIVCRSASDHTCVYIYPLTPRQFKTLTRLFKKEKERKKTQTSPSRFPVLNMGHSSRVGFRECHSHKPHSVLGAC